MRDKQLVAVVAVVAVVLGCGGHQPGAAKPAGDLYDSNPQLAFIPADTAYAVVSFKAMPLELSRRWGAATDAMPAGTVPKTSPLGAPMRVWDEVLGRDHSPEHYAQVGLSETPRTSIYAIDGYPVMRIEIANGNRLVPAIEAGASRAGVELPAPTRVGEWWTVETAMLGRFHVMAAVGSHELVVALGPADILERRRNLILGIDPPDVPIAAAVFRQIGEREGFTGLGLGFVDVRQMIHAFADPRMIAGSCGTAVDAIAAGVPRIVLGYNADERGFDYRTVFELAPAVQSAISALPTEIPRGERTGTPALMSLTAAIDLDRAFALVPAVSAAIDNVAGACGLPDPGMRKLATALDGRPAFLHGITGVAGVMTTYDPGDNTEGSIVVHAADASVLLAGVMRELHGLKIGLAPDRRAIRLLPGLIDPPVYAAMSTRSIAVARGASAGEEAEAALGGEPVPAPLLEVRLDFGQFARQIHTPGAAQLGDLFGEATFTLDAGPHGLVLAGHIETPLANVRAQ